MNHQLYLSNGQIHEYALPLNLIKESNHVRKSDTMLLSSILYLGRYGLNTRCSYSGCCRQSRRNPNRDEKYMGY